MKQGTQNSLCNYYKPMTSPTYPATTHFKIPPSSLSQADYVVKSNSGEYTMPDPALKGPVLISGLLVKNNTESK